MKYTANNHYIRICTVCKCKHFTNIIKCTYYDQYGILLKIITSQFVACPSYATHPSLRHLEFQGDTVLTSEVMNCQVHVIGKAIRPLFADPVTIIAHEI